MKLDRHGAIMSIPCTIGENLVILSVKYICEYVLRHEEWSDNYGNSSYIPATICRLPIAGMSSKDKFGSVWCFAAFLSQTLKAS